MPEEKKPKSRRSGVALAQMLSSRFNFLKSARMPIESTWRDISKYMLPGTFSNTTFPDTSDNEILFDGTALHANVTLANGMFAEITPSAKVWFSFDPPEAIKNSDKAKSWYHQCTEVARMELARSNFAATIHEFFNYHGSFGTASIIALPGKQSTLNFTVETIGSFWIDENDEGIVDVRFSERVYSVRQIVQKWGEDALSPKMRTAWDCYLKDGKTEEKFTISHAVYPRSDDDREYGKRDKANKPWASVYWSATENHVLENTGFDEKPFFVGRFMRQGETVYGVAPGWMALPDARQLNFLEKQLDLQAEKLLIPPILVPSSMVDEIDLRAGGMTIYNENAPNNAMPKEWANTGEYKAGLERSDRKRRAVEKAFFVDMFQMFANYEGPQMTAREVAERSSEKLIQFTPAFDRFTTEVSTPLLRRVFGLLARAGKFPVPPQEALIQTQNGIIIPDPEISYNSRIALAIKQLQNAAFFRTMETIGPMAEAMPEILDNYDFDTISRDSSRNDGLPSNWLMSEEKRDEKRKARAEAQAQQQQLQAALAASQAARNAGSVNPQSAVGQAMSKAV